mmetsp:Transcript_8768/g.18895  ORF Transcript_8768/g.18895 Transcript_8768/m.18895 type:complete len:200 (+) Transcript_8768:935-1534(+)
MSLLKKSMMLMQVQRRKEENRLNPMNQTKRKLIQMRQLMENKTCKIQSATHLLFTNKLAMTARPLRKAFPTAMMERPSSKQADSTASPKYAELTQTHSVWNYPLIRNPDTLGKAPLFTETRTEMDVSSKLHGRKKLDSSMTPKHWNYWNNFSIQLPQQQGTRDGVLPMMHPIKNSLLAMEHSIFIPGIVILWRRSERLQ